jgi:hypothetical protein
VEDHFVEVTEMVEIGSGAQRSLRTVMLSRYACYLVIQNADPSKEIVALRQTYFAIQARRQELSDADVEEQRRLAIRSELRTHNSQLADAAKDAGVIDSLDYAIFQNHGCIGLYGGLGAQDIHRRKVLIRASRSSTTSAVPRSYSPSRRNDFRSKFTPNGLCTGPIVSRVICDSSAIGLNYGQVDQDPETPTVRRSGLPRI